MNHEQMCDALELLAKSFVDLTKKKDLKDLFDKPTKDSLVLLEDALRKSRRDNKKRSNAWLRD